MLKIVPDHTKILIDELLDKIKNSKYVWNYKIDGNVIVLTIRQGKPNVENRSCK